MSYISRKADRVSLQEQDAEATVSTGSTKLECWRLETSPAPLFLSVCVYISFQNEEAEEEEAAVDDNQKDDKFAGSGSEDSDDESSQVSLAWSFNY